MSVGESVGVEVGVVGALVEGELDEGAGVKEGEAVKGPLEQKCIEKEK